MYETWYGKYNVYGAFIEKSIRLLKREGQLILIVPATFMILDEFKKLRTFLSKSGDTTIIYLGPDAFKPEADVASVVLNFHKSEKRFSHLQLSEYSGSEIQLIQENHRWQGEVVTFNTNYTQKLESICSHLLGDIYEIRISPHTPEIKNNPCIINVPLQCDEGCLPLLNGRNLKCNRISYEPTTGYWIKKSEVRKLRGYFGTPHIVVGLGFRENRKVAAAHDERCYPWMGDVYHLHRKKELFAGSSDFDQSEILEYLNSDYLRRYVKDTYREITYHLCPTPGFCTSLN